MDKIKCPCEMRADMRGEDCINTNCKDCCPATYTQTNADRIRSMSDEELAQLLVDGCRGSKCEEQPQNEFGSVNCFDCRMKWLKQPTEVKNDECAKNPGDER